MTLMLNFPGIIFLATEPSCEPQAVNSIKDSFKIRTEFFCLDL